MLKSVSPNGISNMISNPYPDEEPPDLVVQVLNLQKIGNRYGFLACDGNSTIKALISCNQVLSGNIVNLGFIRILRYAVNSIPDRYEKYVFVTELEVVQDYVLKPITSVTPDAIDKLLSNPTPCSKRFPETVVVVQILDTKKIGNQFRFTASDGRKKIRTIIFLSNEASEIENFSLIRVINHSVHDIPHKSAKYLLIKDFQAFPSIGREISRCEPKLGFRLVEKDGHWSLAGAKTETDRRPKVIEIPVDILSQHRVGLIYDERMLEHKPTRKKKEQPEVPTRISTIWNKLQTTGIAGRCSLLTAELADVSDLIRVHSKAHVDWVSNISSMSNSDRKEAEDKLDSIYLNKATTTAAFLAAGSAIKAAERVASKAFDSAVAIIRPPGHHAEPDKAMGFCFLNNVAVAAKTLLARVELGIKRILIVDFDVHHGNGTQKMFFDDRRVLFFSIHKFARRFYPDTKEGSYKNVGEYRGLGYNINFPCKGDTSYDEDYIAVWDQILLPVATQFKPDIILVSAGFDAVDGDPLGGFKLTPVGFSILVNKLMGFAEGRIVLILEGGYNPDAMANCVAACVQVLLGDNPDIMDPSSRVADANTIGMISKVCRTLRSYWPLVPEEEKESDD